MADEQDVRALVVPAHPVRAERDPRRRGRWERDQILRWGLRAIAAAIVIGSAVVAGVLLWNELQADSPSNDIAVSTGSQSAAERVPPSVSAASLSAESQPSGSKDQQDPFEELRYLAAGDGGTLALRSILRMAESTPVATYLRTNAEGLLTGAVFLDEVAEGFIEGVGVTTAFPIDVAGSPAKITGTGPSSLSHVIEWHMPDVGTMRTWGIGTTAFELQQVANGAIAVFQAEDDDAPGLPDGWRRANLDGVPTTGPTWRAYYLADNGEVAVVSSTFTGGAPNQCEDCINISTELDEDGVSIAAIASAARLANFAERLRSTSQGNRRVTDLEFAPLERPTPSADGASRQAAYLPPANSFWQVEETLVHMSGHAVTEPALVLLERDTPEIGPITGAVVARVAPANSFDERSAPSTTRMVLDRGDVQIEVTAWNHLDQELALIAELIEFDDDGFQFARRATSAVGLERRYDTISVNDFPQSTIEGWVFGARLTRRSGLEFNLRVSQVPGYQPAAAAAIPHDNDRVVVSVRGQDASLIVRDDVAALQWEETPGVLISIVGPDVNGEILKLAESLQLLDADALEQATGSP